MKINFEHEQLTKTVYTFTMKQHSAGTPFEHYVAQKHYTLNWKTKEDTQRLTLKDKRRHTKTDFERQKKTHEDWL